jgi:hypothetical protein
MKNTYKYILGLATSAIFFVSACSLEETLTDTPTPSNFLKSNDEVNVLLDGAYSWFPNTYRLDFVRTGWLLGDELYSSVVNFVQAKTTLDINSARLTWRNYYFVVRDANSLLRDVENIPLTVAQKNSAIGQALFLRGWTYFELARMFGGVPIRTKPFIDGELIKVPRSTEQETYQQAIADLKASSELLAYGPNTISNRDRANKGVAQSALALAYLTYGQLYNDNQSLQFAKDYADSVITKAGYTMTPNFADLFDISREATTYNDIIWRVGIIADGRNAGTLFATAFNPNTIANVNYNPITQGAGSAQIVVQPYFRSIYNQGEYINDYRVDFSFHNVWPNRTLTNGVARPVYSYPNVPPTTVAAFTIDVRTYISKYKDQNAFARSQNNNDIPLIRLSEIYLIKAEAEIELNGATQIAVDAFNVVRARARLADGAARLTPRNVTLADVPTKDAFRQKLFDERGLEFLAEGKRWFDLKRMKYSDTQTMYDYRFKTYLPTLLQGAPVYNNTTPRRWLGGLTSPISLFMSTAGIRQSEDIINTYKYLPIPLDETNNNNIPQNPGY